MLAGGLAIMAAAMAELDVARINPVGGALRLGVLYDLLGRTVRRDIRVATVEQFPTRYRIDREHAARVAAMAVALHARAVPAADAGGRAAARVGSAAARNRILGLAHRASTSMARTSCNADMPGFSAGEQHDLALLVLGCRGGLVEDGADARRRAVSRAARWRCGSPCSSTTRGDRSTCRASGSRSARGSARACRRAG